MDPPTAHDAPLPGNLTQGNRLRCGSCQNTFCNIKTRHAHLLKFSHVLPEACEVTVPFYLNLRHQSIRCPLCSFKSKKVKSPRSFKVHFSRHLGDQYTLKIAYTCTMCTEVMSEEQVHAHLNHHRANHIPLTPIVLKDPLANPSEKESSTSTIEDQRPLSTQSLSSSSPSTSATSPSSSLPASPLDDGSLLTDTQTLMSPISRSPPYLSQQDANNLLPECSMDAYKDTSPTTSTSHATPLRPDNANYPPSEATTSSSSPLPDSQNPFSPMQPSPQRLSPTNSDACLMRLFLDACEESTNTQDSIPFNRLPLADTSMNDCPSTPLTSSLLPNGANSILQRPKQTPNLSTPPLLANTTTTPDHRLPSTRQPSHVVQRRPTAADFFDPPATPSTSERAQQPQTQPLLETLHDPESSSSSPPRPSSLPTGQPQQSTCPSPLTEDPSSATFPSSQTTTSLHDFRTRYKLEFDEEMDFHDFQNLTKQFTTEAVELARNISANQRPRPTARRPDRPSARPPIDNRRPLASDPLAAKRLQSLYRYSKKRAARKIFGDESPGFDGTLDEATTYFTQSFGPRDCNIDRLLTELATHVPSADTDNSLFATPSPQELATKLRSLANSAPGRDRLEYRHLRMLDPKCEILAKMFRHCFAAKDVPAEWKTATTILIHKKNDTNDPSNFRPIALMSCLYKLLMAILAKRMTSFAITNNLLSPEQKSARPSEGCYEHAFLLESIVNDARRQPRPLCLAWLDIRNAFGSVPHSALLTTLTHMGFPTDLVAMIQNAYTGATTEVLTPIGKTPSIPIHSGVKQGCPLSAILFNLSLELIIRKCKATADALPRGPLKHHGNTISILAYADDLVIIARNKDALQSQLNAVSEAANFLNLQFRPDKCASLSLSRQTPRVQSNIYRVQDHPIPALTREEHYRYLGVPIGLIHNISDLQTLVDELTTKLTRIETSLLAPWQKLDAIRTFVQPCLTYALRSTDTPKQTLEKYRSQLIKTVRSICSLPNRATTHYIFGSKRTGGLAFIDPCQEAHLQTVVQAVKMLASQDPIVSSTAKRELRQTVRFAAQSDPTPALVSNFLSNQPDRRLDSLRYRTGSLWTRTRRATKHLTITINVPDTTLPTITAPSYADEVEAKDVCRFLHNLEREREGNLLRDLRDQGKVPRALHADKFANGSSWHYTGLNMRFKDWRFIHKARLNCLPTNAVKSRWSDCNPSCRHCEADETLPHVLSHCATNMPAITERHNKVVDRLTNAARSGTITTDQTVQDSNSPVRPDIVIIDHDQVLIIDVCCPFENGEEALDEAVARKEIKYQHLKDHFEASGKSCEVFGFAIGALGAWHPDNERVLNALGMTPRYKNLFRKLCCTDVIQGSTDIYRQHLGCDDVLN